MHQSVQDLLSQATGLPQDSVVLPPVQTAKPVSPNLPVARKNLALPALPDTKPPVKIHQPECSQAVYAKVKPQPRPRNVPVPPALPVSTLRKETKTNDLDISDSEPDYESCNWNQEDQLKVASSDTPLYSTVKPPLHTRRKHEVDANQEHLKTSRQTHVSGNTHVPIGFKQVLSNVLFRDLTRTTPSPIPKSYKDSSDVLAEPDYYEIKK